jgi:septal ring-binding cell division protein DamX
MLTTRTSPIWLLTALLALSSCSASEPTTTDNDTPDETEQEVDMSEYEDFDASPYRAEPPAPNKEPQEHDVPKKLMENKAGADQLVEQRGFRIQLHISINRDEASKKRNQFADWWQAQRKKSQKNDKAKLMELPTYLKYKQPYYRVRAGNFASRAEAKKMLSRVQKEFSDATIVPATVLVRR